MAVLGILCSVSNCILYRVQLLSPHCVLLCSIVCSRLTRARDTQSLVASWRAQVTFSLQKTVLARTLLFTLTSKFLNVPEKKNLCQTLVIFDFGSTLKPTLSSLPVLLNPAFSLFLSTRGKPANVHQKTKTPVRVHSWPSTNVSTPNKQTMETAQRFLRVHIFSRSCVASLVLCSVFVGC